MQRNTLLVHHQFYRGIKTHRVAAKAYNQWGQSSLQCQGAQAFLKPWKPTRNARLLSWHVERCKQNFRANWFNTSDVEACEKKTPSFHIPSVYYFNSPLTLIDLLTHHILYKTTGILESLDWPVKKEKMTLSTVRTVTHAHTQKNHKSQTEHRKDRSATPVKSKWFISHLLWLVDQDIESDSTAYSCRT